MASNRVEYFEVSMVHCLAVFRKLEYKSDMLPEPHFWETLLRLGLAIIFGGILGWEREIKRKPAGLRTFMLVALGSASFTLITSFLFDAAGGKTSSADPLRIVDGIIGGIGFLGAGSIIQGRGSIQGITTAAGIWVVGSIGIATGLGYYLLAGLTTAIAFLIMMIIGAIEGNIEKETPQNPQNSVVPESTEQKKSEDKSPN